MWGTIFFANCNEKLRFNTHNKNSFIFVKGFGYLAFQRNSSHGNNELVPSFDKVEVIWLYNRYSDHSSCVLITITTQFPVLLMVVILYYYVVCHIFMLPMCQVQKCFPLSSIQYLQKGNLNERIREIRSFTVLHWSDWSHCFHDRLMQCWVNVLHRTDKRDYFMGLSVLMCVRCIHNSNLVLC